MLYINTETIAGKEIIECLGMARGSTVRSRNIGRDIFASIKNIVGGEIEEYTKLQADAREQALQRMLDDANRMGADAVVNVRFTTSVVAQGASEILAFGTAVKTNQMNRIIWIAVIVAVIFAIINRIRQKEKEDFDQRDNQLADCF